MIDHWIESVKNDMVPVAWYVGCHVGGVEFTDYAMAVNTAAATPGATITPVYQSDRQ